MERVEILQGTLDLIVLRALSTMGPQHAYGLAARLEQVSEHPLTLNQGTLYPAWSPPGRAAGTRARGRRRETTGARSTTRPTKPGPPAPASRRVGGRRRAARA